MEPERKIEKWLRAYAKKRRGQGGGPFGLHPATRRLLQGEIARKSPAPKDDDDESSSLWEVFRRDWAFLLGFAACIFFVAAVFFHGFDLGSTFKKASATEAMNHLKDLHSAAQYAAGEHGGKLPATLDDLTNELVTRDTFLDPQSKKPFVFAGAGKNLNELPSNSVLAYSPEDKNGRAVLFADGRVTYANKKEFDEITNAANAPLIAMNNPGMAGAEPSVAPAPAMAPPPADMASSALPEEANSSLAIRTPIQAPMAQAAPASAVEMPRVAREEEAQTFASSRQAVESLQNAFKNTISPAQKISVLANFQVQQNGNAIRVVDEDGSVYDGSIQTDNGISASGGALPAMDKTRETSNVIVETAGSVAPAASAPQQKIQAVQNYFFRVTGMNRTLNQTVAFTGTLLPTSTKSATTESFWQNYGTDQLKDDRSAAGGANRRQSEHNAEAAQLPWANVRITGMAVINNSNQIQILAAPVTSTNN